MIRNHFYCFGVWKSPWILNKWTQPLPNLDHIIVSQDNAGTHSYQYIVEIKTRKRQDYDATWQSLEKWKNQIPHQFIRNLDY